MYIADAQSIYIQYNYDNLVKYFTLYCQAHSLTYGYEYKTKTVNGFVIFLMEDKKHKQNMVLSLSPIFQSIYYYYYY